MRRILLVIAASLFVPAVASAEETTVKTVRTMDPIRIEGRPARPMVIIEIKRETPNIGLRPLVPPKSFMGNQ